MICHFCINIHFGCSAPQTVQTVVIHSLFDPKIDLGWQETGHQENVIQETESAAITTPSKPKSPLATSNQWVHKNNQPSSWCQLVHHKNTSIHFSIFIAETQLKVIVQLSSTDRAVIFQNNSEGPTLLLFPGQVISHTPTMSMLDQLNAVGAALSVLKCW